MIIFLTGFSLPLLWAQEINGTIDYTLSSRTIDSETIVTADIFLWATPATDLGSASIRFFFNDPATGIPSGTAVNEAMVDSVDYTFFDFNKQYLLNADPVEVADYSSSNAVHTTANEISLNIVLSSTGTGKALDEQGTTIATLYFTIVDFDSLRFTDDFSWHLAGLNATEFFAEDNITPLALGSFNVQYSIPGASNPENSASPFIFSLSQNYPNPFRRQTTIPFSVDKPGRVVISLYNLLGQKLNTLYDATRGPGALEVTFNGTSLPSGMYFYELRTGAKLERKSMLHVK